MNATPEDIWLEPSFPMKGDEPGLDGALGGPHLLHDPDLVVLDVAEDVPGSDDDDKTDQGRNGHAGDPDEVNERVH